MDDLIGKTLGPFQIEGRLGEGAMGAVYRARHRKTDKVVAIKVVNSANDRDSTFTARFEREIKLLSQFRHPNIVKIHGDSEHDGVRYYAMEMIDGKSLDDILAQQGKLSLRRTVAYGVQICEALQEIHRVGVIHRDLKPANLMISNDHKVKLMDFGIAKDVTALHTREITQADKTVGTVSYMSPEQLAGQELTRKSDIYALGILLYRMVTGRLPFTGETMFDYMNQRMKGAFALPSSVDPEIPVEIDELIKSMLQQEPENRPRDTYVVMQKLMDISKKAKEGTLTKTKAETDAAMIETIEMPAASPIGTMLRSVTDRFSPARGKSKKRKKRRKEDESFFESPLFLGGSLVIIVAVLAYAFWPAGPDRMLADGKKLLESETYIDWQRAIDGYLTPVIEGYPDSPAAEEAKALRKEYGDKALLAIAKGEARTDRVRNGPSSQAVNARKQYWRAAELKERRKFDEARELFLEIAQRFESDEKQRGWALLAREQLRNEIHGQVYEDVDADGKKDPTDPGLSSWIVYHDANRNGELDEGEPTAETDEDGYYAFSGLARGIYNLRVRIPEGWQAVDDESEEIEVTLSQSEVRSGLDFGVAKSED